MCSLQRELHGPGVLERVERLKQDLLAKVRALGRELPVNTLDELIDQLGGPERVAEVSRAAANPAPTDWVALAARVVTCATARARDRNRPWTQCPGGSWVGDGAACGGLASSSPGLAWPGSPTSCPPPAVPHLCTQ